MVVVVFYVFGMRKKTFKLEKVKSLKKGLDVFSGGGIFAKENFKDFYIN